MAELPMVDRSALTFNQLSIITLTGLGFILDQPILPAFVAAVLVAGSLVPRLAIFKVIYNNVVRPLHLMKPDPIDDDPAPHEFAQLLGGIVLGAGSLFLLSGSPIPGWALAWAVIFLALANLLFGFCAGCFVYFQLGRLGVPGFSSATKQKSAQP